MSSIPASKEYLLKSLGYFWTQVFLDSEFVSSFCSSFAIPFVRIDEKAYGVGDYLSRNKLPSIRNINARIFIFSEKDEDRAKDKFGDPVSYGDGTVYGQSALSSDNRRFKIDEEYTPKFLCTGVFNPSKILNLGQDYSISNGYITFFENPFDIKDLSVKPISNPSGTIHREFFLWGFQVEEDINAICSYFGTMAGIFTAYERQAYEAVQVAWDLRVDGATAKNTKRLVGIITQTDYIDKAGEVLDIFEEGDRLCVHTTNSIYTAPISASTTAKIGDMLSEGDIIFDTFSIHAGNEEIPFESFEGLSLSKDYIPRTEGSLLFVNDRVSVERVRDPRWYTIEA